MDHHHQELNNMQLNYLDPRRWRKLPTPLLDRILASLPPPAFCRFRSVCRRWYNLIFSDSFLEMYLAFSPRHHWFFFFKRCTTHNSYIYSSSSRSNEISEGYLYDPSEGRWYRMVFPTPPGFSPAGSAGGLITWLSEDAGLKSLIVGNPVVRSFTTLPPTLTQRLCPSLGLVVNDSVFNVMVAGDDMESQFNVKNTSTESFYLDNNGYYSTWAARSDLPRLCDLESGRIIFAEGVFYCLTYRPFNLLMYNIRDRKWRKLELPMHRNLRSPSLVECRGKLFLLSKVEKPNIAVPCSLRLWRFQSSRSKFVDVHRMPLEVYDQFVQVENRNGFDCVGHGDYIMITIKRSNIMMMFDFNDSTWQWVPPCPYVYACGGELRGFAYEPRVATPMMALLMNLMNHLNGAIAN